MDGKEGKFVKVRSKNNNSHDRTKSKSKSAEENSNHDRPFSSHRNNNAAEISRQMRSNEKSRQSKVSQNQQQTKSRSRSADPHGQSQWLLQRPNRDVPDSFHHHHHPRDSWDSDSDISDDNSWTLEPERSARSGRSLFLLPSYFPCSRSSRSRDSRSRSRSQVRGFDITGGQGQRYSQTGVTHRDKPR